MRAALSEVVRRRQDLVARACEQRMILVASARGVWQFDRGGRPGISDRAGFASAPRIASRSNGIAAVDRGPTRVPVGRTLDRAVEAIPDMWRSGCTLRPAYGTLTVVSGKGPLAPHRSPGQCTSGLAPANA